MTTDDHRSRPHPARTGDTPDRPAASSQSEFGRFVSRAARQFPAPERDRRSDIEPAPPSEPGGGQGSGPPDDPDGATGGPPPFDRRKLGWLIAGVALLLVTLFAMTQMDQPGDETATTPTATATAEIALVPTSSPTVAPSPTIAATATATATPFDSAIAARCATACLVRVPAGDAASQVLTATGERPSYATDDWLWAIARRESIRQLDAQGIPITFIRDSPETLHLYATRLPAGQTDDSAIRDIGTIVDSVDGNAIVSVDSLPARVKDLAAAGVWIEKVRPAPASRGDAPAPGSKGPLTDDDLGGLLPQVEAGNIERVVTDLQGMSSTDGSGVGTRHYSTPGNVMAAEYLFRTLEGYGLAVRYDDFITPEGFLSSNIVAELPGRDPGMIYGVMAHLDSYNKDNLSEAPGADDNATGVAAALEIARVLSGHDLQHPVHILLVNAEETGILGSEALARDAAAAKTPYEGIYNLDSVGSDRQGTRIYLNSDEKSSWMTDIVIRINNGYGLGQDIWAEQNPAIVADDNRLREQGFESILVARELYGMSPVHHTANDLRSGVSIDNAVSATQLILMSVAALVTT